MRLRWTQSASSDLEQISNYLLKHSPHYRIATMRKIYDGLQELKRWPHRGRPGIEAGTRELLFLPLPYVAVYRPREDAIEILRIRHTSQDRN